MNPLEIARRMAQLGQEADAVKAYTLASEDDLSPAEHLECAAYLLEHGGDYKISYTTFVQLYNAGHFREDILPIMTRVFYEPNVRLLKNRYERNVKLLSKYPYLFHRDFLPFDELPIVFFPYDDHNGYVPYDTTADEFRDFVNVKDTIVSRNFFKDLEKPILADDVYSQYELEYLVDNVRPSEWVARENHIYLHYTDWAEFCSWLQVLTMKPLLTGKKIVFLIGDELSQYPIDFKEHFGIDYSQYTLEPIHIREINKLIWHTQFSSSNGGDFFNEIFDDHPNLLAKPSILYQATEESVEEIRSGLQRAGSFEDALIIFEKWNNMSLVHEMYNLRNITDKDILVAIFLRDSPEWNANLDINSRIAPALFIQPHFYNLWFTIRANKYDRATLSEEQIDRLDKSQIFRGFKYIKIFTPVRRFTTTYGSTLRFMHHKTHVSHSVVFDLMTQRILNRSYMRNSEDRLFRDAKVVRFEDGKLNPKATFTALAAFLDIPYTESMTYCSTKGVHDVESEKGNAIGFDPVTVYKTYHEWMNDSERYFMEYFMRDAYEFYGYGFEIYDGKMLDDERIKELISDFTILEHYIEESSRRYNLEENPDRVPGTEGYEEDETILKIEKIDRDRNRFEIAKILQRGLHFVNSRKQPLEFTPMLQPDPDLLDQPLYH